MKKMKILEFHRRTTKIYKNTGISYENDENLENIRFQCEKK